MKYNKKDGRMFWFKTMVSSLYQEQTNFMIWHEFNVSLLFNKINQFALV